MISGRPQAPRQPPRPPRLYAIADADALEAPPGSVGVERMASSVEAMADAGAGWIQIRMKQADDRDRFAVMEAVCRRLEGSGARLWIDDRVDLAALFPLAGVHVGQKDLPPSAARRVLDHCSRQRGAAARRAGTEAWIGFSCHDEEQVRIADGDADVDVVACGPIFATTSKADPDPVLGLGGLSGCRRWTSKPLVAIGGIRAERLPSVLEAGADSAVVLGAICRSPDEGGTASLRQIGSNVRALLEAAGSESVGVGLSNDVESSINQPRGPQEGPPEIEQ